MPDGVIGSTEASEAFSLGSSPSRATMILNTVERLFGIFGNPQSTDEYYRMLGILAGGQELGIVRVTMSEDPSEVCWWKEGF